MHYLKYILILILFVGSSASADVWKWVDPNGNTHFVDTDKPIYVWRDSDGRVMFSDKRDHDDAVLVQLVWHAPGSLEDMKQAADKSEDGSAYPGETADERAEREDAEAYYCKKATEIYESYVNAPRLYRTNDAGEKEYVPEEEANRIVEETRAKMEDLCR